VKKRHIGTAGGTLSVTSRLDNKPQAEGVISTVQPFAADRLMDLSIEDVADLEITAGSPEARQPMETLCQRWDGQAVPSLAKAGP
jgi:hypothetical protein